MKARELEELEINALALKQYAEKVLEGVRAIKTTPAIKKVVKKDMGAADLEARILAGRLKPSGIKKKKKDS